MERGGPRAAEAGDKPPRYKSSNKLSTGLPKGERRVGFGALYYPFVLSLSKYERVVQCPSVLSDSRNVSGIDGPDVPGIDSRDVPGIDSRDVSGIDGRDVPGIDSCELPGINGPWPGIRFRRVPT